MSDDGFDRDWKPNGRPQSTMARSFSLALNDLFKIDNSIADLDAAVFEKKKAVSSQTSELEALEARLKATEERLRKAGLSPSTPTTSSFANGRSSPNSNGGISPRSRPGIGEDTFLPTRAEHRPKSPLSTEFKNVSRLQTKDGKAVEGYGAQNMPGALPPTPGASEDGDIPPAERK